MWCLFATSKAVGLKVVILHFRVKSAYSYFYVEVLGNQTPCTGQYMLVSDDHIPCISMIKGSHFRLSFQDTDLILEIRAVDIELADCVEGISNTIATCNVSLYENQVEQKEENISSKELNWISFNVSR